VHNNISVLKDELNVKEVAVADTRDNYVDYHIQLIAKKLGPRFGKEFPSIQNIINMDNNEYVRELSAGTSITLVLNGKSYKIDPDEVEIIKTAKEGYAISEDKYHFAAMDISLTTELIREGLSRDLIRRIQELRKKAKYNVQDRIIVEYNSTEELSQAVDMFKEMIKKEILADAVVPIENPNGDIVEEYEFSGERLIVGLKLV
jgi:isoleucyl-tRNA synthetase